MIFKIIKIFIVVALTFVITTKCKAEPGVISASLSSFHNDGFSQLIPQSAGCMVSDVPFSAPDKHSLVDFTFPIISIFIFISMSYI